MRAAVKGYAQPLLPGSLRPAYLVIAATSTAVFVVLGVRYHDRVGIGRLDARIELWMPWRIPIHSRSLVSFAGLAGPRCVVVGAALLAVSASLLRHWRLAALAVLAPVATGTLVELGKHLVGRAIYDQRWLTYPSGHTAGATSILLIAALGLSSLARKHRTMFSVLGWVVVVAGACAIGTTMVLLGAHFPTDAIGGFCLAVLTTLTCAAAIDGLARAPRIVRAPSIRPGGP